MDPKAIAQRLQHYEKGILDERLITKSAVLIPIMQDEAGRTMVWFEKRARTIRQPGDICFPGGKWDADDRSAWDAAVRETSEELHIPPSSIRYAGELDTVVTHTRMYIYPFVGFVEPGTSIVPDPREVEEVFPIGLDSLLEAEPAYYDFTIQAIPDERFPVHLISNGDRYEWRKGNITQPFYHIDNRVIWGLTARILHHFLGLIREQK